MTPLEFRIGVMLNGSLRIGKDEKVIAKLASNYLGTEKAFGKKRADEGLARSVEWHRKCRQALGMKAWEDYQDRVCR